MMRKRSLILFGILLSIFLLCTVPPPSQAYLFKSNLLTGTAPTIDGLLPTGEWDEAYNNTVYFHEAGDPLLELGVSLYMMNDASDLYILIQWYDDLDGYGEDQLYLYFDEANDNYCCNESDHSVRLYFFPSGDEIYWDNHGDNSGGTTGDINTTDGAGNVSWSGNTYSAEFRIPLGAVDPEDLNAGAGEMIGLSIVIWDFIARYAYPFDAYDSYYSNPLQLAALNSIGTPSFFLVLVILGLFALLTLWKKHPVLT